MTLAAEILQTNWDGIKPSPCPNSIGTFVNMNIFVGYSGDIHMYIPNRIYIYIYIWYVYKCFICMCIYMIVHDHAVTIHNGCYINWAVFGQGWWTSVVEVIRICSMWRKPEVLWLTRKLGKRILRDQKITLWETNIASENRPPEKDILVGNHHFYGLCWFTGGYKKSVSWEATGDSKWTREVDAYGCDRWD